MNKPERQSLTRLLEATGEAMQAGLTAGESLAIAIADEGDQMPKSLREALADAAKEGGQPALRLAGTVGANCEAWLAAVESGPAQGAGLALIADALPRVRKVPAGAVLVIADIVALLAVSILIAAFIAPTWVDLFAATGSRLPAPTRVAIGVAYAMIPMTLALVGAALLAQLWLRRAKSLGGLTHRIDRLVFRLPVVNGWLRIRESSRAARWLSLGRGSALAAFDALAESGSGTLSGRVAARVAARLREGQSLPDALEATDACLPGLVNVLRTAGEQEGQAFARFLERYAFVTSRREGASQEKLILIAHLITGVIIGGYIVAIYLPIFKMGSAI